MNRLAPLCGAAGAFALLSSPCLSAAPATRNREEIPAEYRWDFSPIYASWDAWEAGMKDVQAKMDAMGFVDVSLPC